MPVPLLPVSFQAPGSKGLNTQSSATLLDPGWATELENATFDSTGRITSRKGYTVLTTAGSPGAYNIEQLFCYCTATTTEVISAANNKLYKGTTTLTDITGTITTPTANNWKFQNFNTNKIVAWQAGHTPIVSTAAGNFANITVSDGGSLPTGNVCLSAFGRIWATASDGTTVKYSGLLNETQWASGGAGSFDTLQYWPRGRDFIIAMTVWEDKLVIFGKRSILIYDGAENINTSGAFTLQDTLEGIGCIARDSVQAVGTDVIFLSDTGLRSLKKSIITTKSPLQDLSITVRDELLTYASDGNGDTIRSVYDMVEGFYLLLIPSSTDPVVFCFDVKNLHHYQELPSENVVRVSKWLGWSGVNALGYNRTNILYIGVRDSDNDGAIAAYSSYLDGANTYTLKYKSPWIDLSNEETSGAFYKIPKKATLTLVGGGTYTPTFSWAFDFNASDESATNTVISPSNESEYGIAEYGIGEWNASNREITSTRFQLSHYGQFMRMGLIIPINGKEISLQKIDLFMKKGRISH